MSVKDKAEISSQASEKEYRQEAFLPCCPDEEAPQKIQAYHIEYNMGKTAMDKYTANDRPLLL